MLNIEKIIGKFYPNKGVTYDILKTHGVQVARKSIEILSRLQFKYGIVDRDFIIEASMLHDIGICMTSAKSIGCFGSIPYLCHGVEGRKMLDKIGLFKHGLVCERHIGVGLSSRDIVRASLPLPARDMIPISFEERLICYSDKFFSKGSNKEKKIDDIVNELAKYEKRNVKYFFELHNYFTANNVSFCDQERTIKNVTQRS